MKRRTPTPLLALARGWLLRATAWLLGHRHAAWARAMQAEADAVGDDRKALAFAWGCFCAASGQARTAAVAALAQAHHGGVLAGSTAVLLGCVFMHSAGAPSGHLVMNVLSLALAVATFYLLPRRRLAQDAQLRARLSFALGALLLVASLGLGPAGATAWLKLGPVHLNLPWLLLPALLVAADVRPLSTTAPWALGGLLMACAALALLADPVLTGLVAAVLSVRAWGHRSRAQALPAAAAWATALHLAPAWPAPEALPFVDRVLQSGFERSPATGLALALLQVLPLWPALRHRQARLHGAIWAVLVVLSLPGWLPSPLVGHGGSFIVAYLLSLALVPAGASPAPTTTPTLTAPTASRTRRRPPGWPRSGLT